MIRTLSLLMLALVGVDVSGQVLDQTVLVDGKSVSVQRFTADCIRIAPKSYVDLDSIRYTSDVGWEKVSRKYTVHLIDKSMLDFNRRLNLRPEAEGWYSWKVNKWYRFYSITENALWFEEPVDFAIGFAMIRHCWAGGCRREHTPVFVSDYKWGIERSKLQPILSYSANGVYWSQFNRWHKADGSWPVPTGSKCSIIEYQEPPQRVGF